VAETGVAVTEGSGKTLHGWDRTIGGTLRQDEFILPGEYPYATYTFTATGVATTTANSHLMQVMAGSSLNVRIRRILITQSAAAAAVTTLPLQIVRLSTAGTGGTAITARAHDSADSAAGAAGMTLPSSKGTEGNFLWSRTIWLGTGAIPVREPWEWAQLPNSKPIIIPAGTTNGIALKNTLGPGTATVDITVECVETNFV
jgi:hypothetical protein